MGAIRLQGFVADRRRLRWGIHALELTFNSQVVRRVAVDKNAAFKMLGEELAQDFLSLVADMRNAIYLGELLDTPLPVNEGQFRLRYPLVSNGALEIQPIANGDVNNENWSEVHRIKLVHVLRNGAVIL